MRDENGRHASIGRSLDKPKYVMEFILFLAVTGLFAFIGATMATSRGRSPMLWAILCVLFPLITLWILAVIGPTDDAPAPPPPY